MSKLEALVSSIVSISVACVLCVMISSIASCEMRRMQLQQEVKVKYLETIKDMDGKATIIPDLGEQYR